MISQHKQTLSAIFGTTIEWAEFTFYAYMAVEIAQVFFPTADPQAGIIATFSVFALGYAVRPIGALLFGFIGDRFGRRLALQLSIITMGLATCAIGLLPTYHQIGIFAPCLLLIFRMFQGLAVSGEYNGASIFLMEHTTTRKCLAGSWAGWAAAVGMLLGSLLATFVTLPIMPSWAWRIPFVLSGLACWYGYILRNFFSETPEYLNTNHSVKKQFPLKEIILQQKKSFFIAILFSALVGVFIYIGNIYYVSFLVKNFDSSLSQAKFLVCVGELFVVLFFPFSAILSDHFNEKIVMSIGLISITIFMPIYFWLPNTHSMSILFIGQIVFAFCDALFIAPLFKFLYDQFPTHIRYSAVSAAWNIAMALFGGTAPLFAQLLLEKTHLLISPGLYIALFAVLCQAYFLINGKSVSQ